MERVASCCDSSQRRPTRASRKTHHRSSSDTVSYLVNDKSKEEEEEEELLVEIHQARVSLSTRDLLPVMKPNNFSLLSSLRHCLPRHRCRWPRQSHSLRILPRLQLEDGDLQGQGAGNNHWPATLLMVIAVLIITDLAVSQCSGVKWAPYAAMTAFAVESAGEIGHPDSG